MEMENEVEIPAHFLCPISLQLMRDPVTVSTGITYDRESIEEWLFSYKHNTCPVTKQVLSSDTDLIPNHTLRRLIQAWCTLNASYGIERIPTPKPPVDKIQIAKLITEAKKFPHMQFTCLQRLRSIALESERNRNCLESSVAVEFLVSIMKKNINQDHDKNVSDEVLSILYHLKLSETKLKSLVRNDEQFFDSFVEVLKNGNYRCRAYAIMLLKSIFEVADPANLISLKQEIIGEIVNVLRDQISHQASKAALKLLVEICPWGRNRIKTVQGGGVGLLIELLLEVKERRECELILVLLDQLCGCAEGRAELICHGAGIAIVSKKILRVSHAASDRAVKILSSICRFSATLRVLQEMLQVGVVSKLCLVLQVDSSSKAKDRTREILRLHSRVWRHSPCIPPHLVSSYPS
ncbi:E3 ubiquitin-protein ligase PUB23-like [Tripterygium wilfordii]|uniref:U-box domain-containing protein n=1 Tax=Tripterygium wilfordii TaxID=458696 RepID=A0A7J7DF14_TRIWF|nr:E3 ubiquitin-protein ligase PUB22-like [Tripterygium wilfordii]KAF5744922.1 E3 ubiquitin-protein ligase PUB23-like [Tripterygium wilfordii]